MKHYIFIFALLSLIIKVKNVQYISLTPEDKEYLKRQLPKNHKYSLPMQQIFNESHLKIYDDRAKRQYMIYPPDPYHGAAPAYQLNLPIMAAMPPQTNPYVVMPQHDAYMPEGPHHQQIQARANYPHLPIPESIKVTTALLDPSNWNDLRFENFSPTTVKFDLDGIANKAFDEAIKSRKDSVSEPHTESIWKTASLTKRKVLEETTALATATTPLKDLQKVSSGKDFAEYATQPTKQTREMMKTTLGIRSVLERGLGIELSAFNQSECEAMTPEGGVSIPSLPPLSPIKSIVPTPSLSGSPQKDAALKDKLIQILEDVESMKSKVPAPKEGLPCSIVGKWISSLAGGGFEIDQTNGINFNVPILPSLGDGFLKNGEWRITASTPLENGGLFVLTATRLCDLSMATFTGECRTCNSEEIVTGHWLMVKPALTCEEMNKGQDFFGDTWRRQAPPTTGGECATEKIN
ncbi:uncharacterized protein [Atheta coriaria]|uniref:uncharacterized protein n=1 Tax=Dalotia coriaria TaxID=877792 RepID=UPI0031F428D8